MSSRNSLLRSASIDRSIGMANSVSMPLKRMPSATSAATKSSLSSTKNFTPTREHSGWSAEAARIMAAELTSPSLSSTAFASPLLTLCSTTLSRSRCLMASKAPISNRKSGLGSRGHPLVPLKSSSLRSSSPSSPSQASYT